jgi:hypothetical protein
MYMSAVPVPASEALGHSAAATPAPYAPVNGTTTYVPGGMASSTSKGAAAYTGGSVPAYTPPLYYEGAGSRLGVGMCGVVALVAGALLL